MGWRARKRIKIAKGLYINLGKKGASVSVGTRGGTFNLSSRGTRATVGLPGTGLSYSTSTPLKRTQNRQVARSRPSAEEEADLNGRLKAICVTLLLAALFTPAWPLALAIGALWLAVAMWPRISAGRARAKSSSANPGNQDDVLMSAVYAAAQPPVPDLDALSQKREFPRLPQRESTLPDTDAWETGYLADLPDQVPLHTGMFIRYCDGRQQLSSRHITLRSIVRWENDDIAMLAYCHERDAHRTFLASRVLEAVLTETGEILPNLPHWLRLHFAKSPQGRIARALKVVEPECLILAYIARADGAMRAKERALIAEFISEAGYEFGIDSADEVELDQRVRSIYCDYDEFRRSIDRLRDGPAQRRRAVLRVARDIIATDKRVDPVEQKAVDALSAMLA